jgi:hypothetical protein
MGSIPDIVFLMLGIACLMVLLSIRSELRKITGRKKIKPSEWSFEDMEKHRVKYLYHCEHLKKHA